MMTQNEETFLLPLFLTLFTARMYLARGQDLNRANLWAPSTGVHMQLHLSIIRVSDIRIHSRVSAIEKSSQTRKSLCGTARRQHFRPTAHQRLEYVPADSSRSFQLLHNMPVVSRTSSWMSYLIRPSSLIAQIHAGRTSFTCQVGE